MASKYFDIPPDADGITKAKCKLCNSYISGSTKTTSNFSTHLKRKHREEYLAIKDVSSSPSKAKDQASMASFVQTTKKFSMTDQHQIQITDALIHFVAGDLMPLSVVNSANFRSLLNQLEPRYQVPDRKTLSTKLLRKKSVEVQSNLKLQLKQAESVALTIDLWSNRQMRGFLGITGHFILDWALKSAVIACKRFKGKHCAENIYEEYEQYIATYDIADKITHIVTDNAANMIKAFDFPLPGYVDTYSDKENTKDEDSVSDEETSDAENSSADNDIEEDISLGCNENISQHKRCYAHTLQFVIKDGFKEANQSLRNILGKVSTIASYARRSLKATEILEGENRIQSSNLTRWNSQLIMVRSVLKIPVEKLDSLETTKLTIYEHKLLDELCLILTPFEHATILVQKENNVSASLALPATKKLKESLESLSASYNVKFVAALKASFKKRMEIYESDEVYQLAAALDPRFKMDWFALANVSAITEKLSDAYLKISDEPSQVWDSFSPPSKMQKLEKPEDLF